MDWTTPIERRSEGVEAFLDDFEAPDRVLDALGTEHRRHALSYLLANGDADLEEVVAAVATDEAAATVELSLYHAGLPALADVGLVEFDPETLRVAATPAARDAEPLLEDAAMGVLSAR